jgi:protein-S-isoprenylcysteine O-methyltransferase Ste14
VFLVIRYNLDTTITPELRQKLQCRTDLAAQKHPGSKEASAMAAVSKIKDKWRFDKSNWRLKTGICGTLVLCAITMYLREFDLASCARSCGSDSILAIFGVVYAARLLLSMLVLLPRPPDWHEIPIVYVVFIPSVLAALAYGRTQTDVCGPWHCAAVVLYVLGSLLSSVGEYQRYVFKARPANKGKLMTTGLWAWSMHVNYLGDSLLFCGWTLAAGGAWWTWLVPTLITLLFVFMHIPNLDEYLSYRYPEEFPSYAAKTSKLVPWIY